MGFLRYSITFQKRGDNNIGGGEKGNQAYFFFLKKAKISYSIKTIVKKPPTFIFWISLGVIIFLVVVNCWGNNFLEQLFGCVLTFTPKKNEGGEQGERNLEGKSSLNFTFYIW